MLAPRGEVAVGRIVPDGLHQRLRHGGLERAVAATVHPLQAAARQAVVQLPRRLRTANPVQAAMQNRRRHRAQASGPLQQADVAPEAAIHQVVALHPVLVHQRCGRSPAGRTESPGNAADQTAGDAEANNRCLDPHAKKPRANPRLVRIGQEYRSISS